MKPNLKFSIILFLIVLVIAGIFQAGQKKPVSWYKSYNPKDKNPYGTYILRHELKNMFVDTPQVSRIRQSLYTFLKKNDSIQNDALFFVGGYVPVRQEGINEMLHFVKNGGTVFLATNNAYVLFDTLGLAKSTVNFYKTGQGIDAITTYLSLYKNGKKVKLDKMSWPSIFAKLPAENSTLIGEVWSETTHAPNFIRIQYGKGNFYFHLVPELFTNYYLLKDSTFTLAAQSLQCLQGKDILWFDRYYRKDDSTTPMRFILQEPALRAAWYLLLLILLLYIVFQSRREQRAIPIITPEKNQSVDFAKTIGSLYYENGSTGDMVQKKIHYFLYAIRKQFRLDTENIIDPKFLTLVQERTGMPKKEIAVFFEMIEKYRNKKEVTVKELKEINKMIVDFKEKANMNI